MRTQLPGNKCYLARKVEYGGKTYGLSTVELCGEEVIIANFEKETPSTVFVDGVIIVESGEYGPVLIQER